MTLRDTKRMLRDQVIAARDALAPARRAEASEAIAARIAALPRSTARKSCC